MMAYRHLQMALMQLPEGLHALRCLWFWQRLQ
jgi:hypothetical protein